MPGGRIYDNVPLCILDAAVYYLLSHKCFFYEHLEKVDGNGKIQNLQFPPKYFTLTWSGFNAMKAKLVAICKMVAICFKLIIFHWRASDLM